MERSQPHRMSEIGMNFLKSLSPVLSQIGSSRAGCPGLCPAGFECLHRLRPHSLLGNLFNPMGKKIKINIYVFLCSDRISCVLICAYWLSHLLLLGLFQGFHVSPVVRSPQMDPALRCFSQVLR